MDFEEVDAREGGGREGLRERFGAHATTFPQVVVGGRHVGDTDRLTALERSGELDALLTGAGGRWPA